MTISGAWIEAGVSSFSLVDLWCQKFSEGVADDDTSPKSLMVRWLKKGLESFFLRIKKRAEQWASQVHNSNELPFFLIYSYLHVCHTNPRSHNLQPYNPAAVGLAFFFEQKGTRSPHSLSNSHRISPPPS